MAIAIKSVTVGTNNGSSATVSVTTSESPSATSSGDLVVIFHCNNFYLFSNMPNTPSATGSPTMNAITNGTADAGSNGAHIKSYWYVANTGGAQTVSVAETGAHDEEKLLVAYVLSGADTTTPIDGGSAGAAGNFSATSATPFVAPAVTPTNADAFLICHAHTGGGSIAHPFSPPGGMAERYDSFVGGLSYTGATQQLSASGSTGTKSFTPNASQAYASLSVAIKTAAAASNFSPPIIRRPQRGLILRGRR